jgi:hypothetical protein
MFGNKKGLEQELSAHGGVIAPATVIAAETGWTSGSNYGNGPYTAGNKNHMKVTLNVEPEGQPAFHATFHQTFPGDIPIKGWSAKVIYDANDHSKIAIMEGQIFPGTGPVHQITVSPDQLANFFTAGVAAESNVPDELTKLADLHDRGVLTEAEFEVQKARLLAGS